VGLMTVSRVINHHPSVRPSTRKRVEAAIVDLGYRQNEAARQLKGQRAKIIGLIVPDLSDVFFASCAHTIQHIARSHGYMTLVASSERDPDLEVSQAELMAGSMISGLLIATSARQNSEKLLNLQSTGLTIVAFDRPLLGGDISSVLVENSAGAKEAVQHLMQHGHTRIVCVGYDETVYTIQQRIEGYTQHMYSAGLKPQVVHGLVSLEEVRRWLAATMDTPDRPTAIFSLNHRTSTFLLQAMTEQGVRAPEEMALIGFDDFDLASIMRPPLTTVAQSPVELSRRSMNLLMQYIQDPKSPDVRAAVKILLPTRLIVRGSCGIHSADGESVSES
jgi:LacI family transcriptional regulator